MGALEVVIISTMASNFLNILDGYISGNRSLKPRARQEVSVIRVVRNIGTDNSNRRNGAIQKAGAIRSRLVS
jgi:hypothetical protein